MNILSMLSTFIVEGILGLFKRDEDEYEIKHCGMEKYLVKYKDFHNNSIGTEIYALTYAVALDAVKQRTDCKSLAGWERL